MLPTPGIAVSVSQHGLSGSSSTGSLNQAQRHSLDAANDLYEPPLPADLLSRHNGNQARVAEAIHAFFDRQPGLVLAQDRPRVLAEHLMRVLQEARFDADCYRPRAPEAPQGYGKYLLYTETDTHTSLPFCLQVFAFGAAQKTPIHDHPCACTSVVFKGRLKERFYTPHAEGQAVKYHKRWRTEGSRDTLQPHAPNTHSLKTPPDEGAVSVHLYLLDGVSQPAAVGQVFRRAP